MNDYKGSQSIELINRYMHGLGLALKLSDDSVSVVPLSTQDIDTLSFGAVKIPETLNYRTHRAEKDGIFCERIFGPERDWECYCGKYKGIKHKGNICDRCDVEITSSSVRSQREGHIDLITPVINPIFIDYLADSLGMSQEEFRKSLYFREDSPDRDELIKKLKKREKDMVLEKIVVLPPNSRPLVFLADENAFATSDCNDLYRRVINRNNRLSKLIDLNAPDVIITNEKRMLQQTVDALFINESLKRPTLTGTYGNQALRSISTMLIEELGSFFGKNQDYSGSAVVSFNPKLDSKQCGLPEQALLTLYEPVIINNLKEKEIADTIRNKNKLLKGETDNLEFVTNTIRERKNLLDSVKKGETENREQVISALNQAARTRPLIVTKGSKAIALYPTIQESESIGLSNEACSQLGLKLNGEKINFYVPLSDKAVEDTKQLVKTVSEGDGQIDSVFSTLAENKLDGIVKLATTGEKIPLSELDKLLLS